MNGWRIAAVILCATCLSALEVKGSTFADQITVGDRSLVVRGGARLNWGWFVTIYDAAFYLTAGTPAEADPLSDIAKRFEVVYARNFTAAECAEATTKTFGRGLPATEVTAAQSALAAFNAAYVEVHPGDRFSYTYVPGSGTTLACNGRDLATIPGDGAARCLFAIWVGPEPVKDGLKDGLLGKP